MLAARSRPPLQPCSAAVRCPGSWPECCWWSGAPWRSAWRRCAPRTARMCSPSPGPFPQGSVVQPGDLRVVKVTPTAGLDPVPAVSESSTVGRPAAVALVAGTLLTPADLAPHPGRPSGDVVAVALKAGAYPPSLGPGGRVDVVPSWAALRRARPCLGADRLDRGRGAFRSMSTPAGVERRCRRVLAGQSGRRGPRWLRSRRQESSRSSNFRPDRAAEEGSMSVVAIASVRSCGVTTLTAGLAMVWPGQRQRLVVEADPAGGMLAAAAGLPPEPGLGEPGGSRPTPRRADGRLRALPGPSGRDSDPVRPPDCGAGSLGRSPCLSGLLGRLGELDADVFVDCGRLEPAASNAVLSSNGRTSACLVSGPGWPTCTPLAAFLEGRNNAARRADARARRFRPLPARRSSRRARPRRRRTRSLGSRCSAGAGDHAGGLSPTHPHAAGAGACARWPTISPAGSVLEPGAIACRRAIPCGERSRAVIGGWRDDETAEY